MARSVLLKPMYMMLTGGMGTSFNELSPDTVSKSSGANVRDAIGIARLQFEQALRAFLRPAQHKGWGLGLLTPIIGVGFQGHAFATLPFLQLVRASADGFSLILMLSPPVSFR